MRHRMTMEQPFKIMKEESLSIVMARTFKTKLAKFRGPKNIEKPENESRRTRDSFFPNVRLFDHDFIDEKPRAVPSALLSFRDFSRIFGDNTDEACHPFADWHHDPRPGFAYFVRGEFLHARVPDAVF